VQDEPLYALSAGAAVLSELHDCPAILSAIAEGGEPAHAEVAPRLRERRGHYLIVLDQREARAVRNFEIDESSVRLLEEFRRPRMLGELGEDGAGELVESLVELGVLYTTTPMAHAAATPT
jgi:hypothetical protein